RRYYSKPIPEDAERVTIKGKKGKPDVPAVRVRDSAGKLVVAPLNKEGTRYKLPSPYWYGKVPGQPKAVKLCTDKAASEIMLGDLLRKAEMKQVGAGDPFEEHNKRPLSEHLEDYRRELAARDNAPRYVELVHGRLRDLLAGCSFV